MHKVGDQGDAEKWERFEIKEKGVRKLGAAKSTWIKTDKSGVVKPVGRLGAREQARLVKEGEGLETTFKVQIVRQSALGRILPGYKGKKVIAQITLTPGERRQIQVSEGMIINVDLVKKLVDPAEQNRKKELVNNADKLVKDITTYGEYLDKKARPTKDKPRPPKLLNPLASLVKIKTEIGELKKAVVSGKKTDIDVEKKLVEFEKEFENVKASVPKLLLHGPKKRKKELVIADKLVEPAEQRRKIELVNNADKLVKDITTYGEYLDKKARPTKDQPLPPRLVSPLASLVKIRIEIGELKKAFESGEKTDIDVEKKLKELEKEFENLKASVPKLTLHGPKNRKKEH